MIDKLNYNLSRRYKAQLEKILLEASKKLTIKISLIEGVSVPLRKQSNALMIMSIKKPLTFHLGTLILLKNSLKNTLNKPRILAQ
jgi:hypothetical protein